MYLYKRLDLLVASFLINILGLAIPIYIIHAINRYLGNGNFDTLIFLTVTVIIAACIEFLIRKYRKFIIININNKNLLKIEELQSENFFQNEVIQKELDRIKSLPGNYDFNKQVSFFDVPYVILFSVVIYLLSPLVFFIYIFLALIILIISLFNRINKNKQFKNINDLSREYSSFEEKFKQNFVNFKVNSIFLKTLRTLKKKQVQISNKKNLLDSNIYDFETLNSLLLNVLIIFVVMISLLEINRGDMQISSMIALNILVVRALLPVKLIPNIIFDYNFVNNNLRSKSNTSKRKLNFENLKPIKNIRLNNISFMYQGSTLPIFNQFSINFPMGSTTVVTGENGSGKSTLFNIVCGALLPLNGTLQINGIDIDRNQNHNIIELSSIINQNPVFKIRTILECIENSNNNKEIDDLENLLLKCNLSSFFNDKNEGINLDLIQNENHISLGISKRIALAQIFYKDSEIIIFDEPTQGCDNKTCEVIYNFLNEKISENKIVIIFSNDPFIIQGAQVVIELKKGNKPIYLKK